MPAGDLEVMGKVRILGMDVEKSILVYEGKIKAVSYNPALVDGRVFVMQVDDIGIKDYAAVDLTMEMQMEVDQILSTLEVVGAGE